MISAADLLCLELQEDRENVDKPIDAVMMFHDSVDWGRDLQLCLDVLASKGMHASVSSTIVDIIHCSNGIAVYILHHFTSS